MRRMKIALTGLGNVGRNFVNLLADKKNRLRKEYGLDVRLVSVVDLKGAVKDEEGLNLQKVSTLPSGVDGILSHPLVDRGSTGPAAVKDSGADVLVEATPTDVETGEPGLSHFRAALGEGMDVVTLAKGPLVVDWSALNSLAQANGAAIKFSGATAAALPTIDVAEYSLAAMEVKEIRGILNGTTNYILTRMHEDAMDFSRALQRAQDMGIAEPDPALDVEGYDTAAKMCILANAVLQAEIALSEVSVRGITEVSPRQVRQAEREDKVIKLIGTARVKGEGVEVRVAPQTIGEEDPLAGVRMSNKGVHFDTEEMGSLTVTGGKSDPRGAAAAAFKDLVNLGRRKSTNR